MCPIFISTPCYEPSQMDSFRTTPCYKRFIADANSDCDVLNHPNLTNQLDLISKYWFRWGVIGHLTQPLVGGKRYCATFYTQPAEKHEFYTDNIAMFVENNLGADTLLNYLPNWGNNDLTRNMYCFLNRTVHRGGALQPKLRNPVGNILNDTLNWTKIQGVFIANGGENELMFTGFGEYVYNDTLIHYQTNYPHNGAYYPSFQDGTQLKEFGSMYFVSSISIIDYELEAYAGHDTVVYPGDSVWLGRSSEIGLHESSWYEWYPVPDTLSYLGNGGGIAVFPSIGTHYYVYRQDICGNIKYDTVMVTGSMTAGVQGSEDKRFNFYPNPATEEVYFVFSGSELMVRIYDVHGRKVREGRLEQGRRGLSVKGLPPGVYEVEARSDLNTINYAKLLIAP